MSFIGHVIAAVITRLRRTNSSDGLITSSFYTYI